MARLASQEKVWPHPSYLALFVLFAFVMCGVYVRVCRTYWSLTLLYDLWIKNYISYFLGLSMPVSDQEGWLHWRNNLNKNSVEINEPYYYGML